MKISCFCTVSYDKRYDYDFDEVDFINHIKDKYSEEELQKIRDYCLEEDLLEYLDYYCDPIDTEDYYGTENTSELEFISNPYKEEDDIDVIIKEIKNKLYGN